MSAAGKIGAALRLAAAMILAAGMAACVSERTDEVSAGTAGATLRLSTRQSVTRADEHFGDDPFAENEEAIERVTLFFFSSRNTEQQAFFTYDNKNAGAQTTAELTVRIPTYLLAGADKAYVYALVNLPESVAVDAAGNRIALTAGDSDMKPATLANLGSVWVSDSGFATRGDAPETFFMRGGADVTVAGSGSSTTVAGVILVERLAAKIRLWADIESVLYIDATTGKTINRSDYASESEWNSRIAGENVETWRPIATRDDGEPEVKMYLYNLATRGRTVGSAVGGEYFGDDYPGSDYDRRNEMWEYRDVDRSDECAEAVRPLVTGLGLKDGDVDGGRYLYTHALAYYSYPNIWNSASPAEQHQTYVVVSVLWEMQAKSGQNARYQVCYYQIPVNALRGTSASSGETYRLDPNRYYRINVHIGMLGSRDMGNPTELEAGYEVVDWVTNYVDVNIKDRRYLVVNQKEWTMNNISTVEIPFSSSHKTMIEDCFVTYFRYRDAWGNDQYANGSSGQNTSGLQPEDIHNKTEFNDWLAAATSAGVKETEGKIEMTLNGVNTMLYYKKKYFYDEIYQKQNGNGYRYYVGHEQPKTFQQQRIGRQQNRDNGMTAGGTDDNAWGQYYERYGLDSIYTYSIDNKRGVVNFSHPLIQWKEVTGGRQPYYVPELNPRTGRLWDEFSRIEVTIVIRHEDWTANDGLYRETIHITQYPGLYIEVSHNYGTPSGNEYVLVNGRNTNSTSTNASFQNVVNTMTSFLGSNNNPNMYVIHTTQLSEDNGGMYEIGDPRTLNRNNYLLTDVNLTAQQKQDATYPKEYMRPLVDGDRADWMPSTTNKWTGLTHGYWNINDVWRTNRWYTSTFGYSYNNDAEYDVEVVSAPDVNGSRRKLEWYYPTDETEGYGSKENFIAPVLRVASSFGKVAVDGRPQMRRRCATYQEAGRPAGRWRLPTRAEVYFIAQLSADRRIPILFGAPTADKPGYYWTAQCGINADGVGNVYDNEGNEGDPGQTAVRIYPYGTFAARCVYDEWYWTQIDGTELPTPNGELERTFYWGDSKKDNTQAQ